MESLLETQALRHVDTYSEIMKAICIVVLLSSWEIQLQAEPCGAMREIEIAFKKNLLNLWLEKHSSLVVQAFKSSNLIPWKVRNS